LLSVAILVSAIFLIAADFRMLGEMDAAMTQTNVLGHHRSDAYQLLALTERLARDTGEQRARTLGEVGDVRGQIDRRFDAIRGGRSADPGPETFWRSQIVPALDQLMAGHDPATLLALNATVKRYVAEMDESQKNVDAAARRDADRFRTIQYGFLLFVAFVCLVTLYLLHNAARRVRVLVQVAERSSSGDHAADAPSLGDDEVGRLGEAWNAVLATIRHLLGEEKAARVRLETLLAGVSETANGISAAAAELLAGTTEQSAAAQQQAAAVAQTVSTVNQVADLTPGRGARSLRRRCGQPRGRDRSRGAQGGRRYGGGAAVGEGSGAGHHRGDHGSRGTGPGHRRDHLHREGPRGADEPPRLERRHRGFARRGTRQGIRGGGR